MRLDARGEYPPDWPAIAVRTRAEAGHRCIRCHHRFVPQRDAKVLGIEPSGGEWSPCDEHCTHAGPIRIWWGSRWGDAVESPAMCATIGEYLSQGHRIEARWRILTVHHLDGDKGNCRWWNLLALCQRCHLTVQGTVIPERPWLFEHTAWFRPYVAGFYALYYGEEEITREEAERNTDHWLTVGQPWRVTA